MKSYCVHRLSDHGRESLADTSLIKIDSSPHAKMQNVGLDEVTITGGFWKKDGRSTARYRWKCSTLRSDSSRQR